MILFHRIIFQEETKLLLSGLAGLLLLLGTSESWWWGTDLTSSARSVADVTVMDGSRDAVVLLQVNLNRSTLEFEIDKSSDKMEIFCTVFPTIDSSHTLCFIPFYTTTSLLRK